MKDEYRNIHGFPLYKINPKGEVISLKNRKRVLQHRNGSGYLVMNLYDANRKRSTVGVHRALALAFLDVPEGYDKMVVNHIDGDKTNNDINNLEWCTQTDNIKHAGLNGLTPKCKPIEIKNWLTGEVTIYDSFIDAAKALNITKDAISWKVSIGEHRIDELFNQYRLHLNSSPEWVTPTIWDCGILVRDVLDGCVRLFENQADVCDFLSLSPGYISRLVNDGKQPVFRAHNSLYQIRRNVLTLDWVDYDNPYHEYERVSGKRCVVMYNPDTDKPRIWLSATEASNFYGYGKHVVFWRCKQNKQTIWDDGLICHYLN